MPDIPETMQAAVLDRFGGVEEITVREVPVPELGPTEVLIRVESAGVAVWDAFERGGGFAEMMGMEASFPYILGSDGAGTIVAAGDEVESLSVGDCVYAASLVNPKGGFYAEYAAVAAALVSAVPEKVSTDQAGVMGSDALTALRGLDDALGLQAGETLMVFGASGGVGHFAVQLAKGMGARVFAVASGEDGVALVRELGADAVADGHREDVLVAAREFAPEGLDAALLTAAGEIADGALAAVREGGRAAHPNGIMPVPNAPAGLEMQSYDVVPIQPEAIARLNRAIESAPFHAHIDQTFLLSEAADAHRALRSHFLGKLALRPS